MTEPPAPRDERWPTSDEPTIVETHETAVGGAPPPAPVAPPPPDRRIGAGMLLALGALALVAVGILIAYLLSHRDDKQSTTVVVTTAPAAPAKVSVPRLVGLKEQEALDRLSQAGLRPKLVFKPTTKPTRLVVSQKPGEATQLPKGGTVTLVIDSGAPKVTMPDLSGQSFADAQSKLDALGLQATKTEVTSSESPGTVVDQAPKAGEKLAKGATVTLSVAKGGSTGTSPTTTTSGTTTGTTTTTTTSATTTSTTPSTPANATVPDVTGQTEQQAATAFAQAGVLASIVFVPGQDPLGTVVQQAKPGGTTVPYHAHVQINVSRGPGEKPDVSVPDATGQTLKQAVSTMNGAGLRLIYVKLPVTATSQIGKIVQQSPLAGGKAPRNAQVLVYLGVKPS